MEKTKSNLFSFLILAVIHLCFLTFVVYPVFGYFTILGVAPLFFLKKLPLSKLNLNSKELLIDVIVFTASIFFTIWIQIHFQKSAVFAASAVGVFVSFIPQNSLGTKPFVIRNLNQGKLAAYSGAFAGMTSISHMNSIVGLVMIGILGGFLFSFLRNSFNGVGGKLGSIAYGSVIFYLIISSQLWN